MDFISFHDLHVSISIYLFYCHLYDKFQFIHTFICLLYASISLILYIINFKLSIHLYVLFKSFICYMFYTILYTWSLLFISTTRLYIKKCVRVEAEMDLFKWCMKVKSDKRMFLAGLLLLMTSFSAFQSEQYFVIKCCAGLQVLLRRIKPYAKKLFF